MENPKISEIDKSIINSLSSNNNQNTNQIEKGVIIDEQQNRYEGSILNGKAEGYGIKYYKDGRKFEGTFKNNKRDGEGTLYRPDGTIYKGSYKNDVQNGIGINYNKEGKILKALFNNGKVIRGSAIMYYGQGNNDFLNFDEENRYEGDYKNNRREGYGKLFLVNGNRYEGEFQNDLFTGNGKYFWPNGCKYVGGFKNDKKDGKGILYLDGGNRVEGLWKNGMPLDVQFVHEES